MTTGPRIVKKLSGHSGSEIYLMENSNGLFVRKIGNTERNRKRLIPLSAVGFPVPKIYNVDGDSFDMEYFHGLDIKNYLVSHNTNQLEEFLFNTLTKLKSICVEEAKDFTEIYHQKLAWMDTSTEAFPFTKKELIDKLPKILPHTSYLGDLTLENIIYTIDGFKIIDPVTIEYESYVFDIAKLRQDLECRWFLRKETTKLGAKLHTIQNKLFEDFPEANNDYLLILMLLRVYLHTTKGDLEYNFIMDEIKRLWK